MQMDTTTYTITQKRFLRGQQVLTINGDKLKVEYRRGLSLHEYRFDLRGLLPDPIRIRQIPMVALVILTWAVVLSLTLISIGNISQTDLWGVSVLTVRTTGALLLMLTLFCWIHTAKRIANVVVFEGPGGRVILWPDRPNKNEFSKFLSILSAQIRNTQSPEQTLLRRLRQAGIIDEWQFNQAMELLQEKADEPGNQ